MIWGATGAEQRERERKSKRVWMGGRERKRVSGHDVDTINN